MLPVFFTKFESMKNFKPAFIDGSLNVLISAVKDHAATDMHAYAMKLLKKQQSFSVVNNASIAKCFAEASMDWPTLAKTIKFDISYMIAKEKLVFTKMKPICELEESHGVNLFNYLSKTFFFFFFSLQANASVDARKVELRVIFNNLF